jgi:hypothetical protein
MPSIFIWKADLPNTSKDYIKMHLGSNWMLEENEYETNSYMYKEQIVIPEINNSVITFNFKNMPRDWMGSELLEIVNVPYKLIKSDDYGTLEMIGCWMRFKSRLEIEFNIDSLVCEFKNIQKWINGPANNSNNMKRNTSHTNQHISLKPQICQQLHQSSLPPSLHDIQQNFNEFYNKYAFNTVHMRNV